MTEAERVPVEVPEEPLKSAIRDDLAKAGLDCLKPGDRAVVMLWLNKAYPLIAARVRAEERQQAFVAIDGAIQGELDLHQCSFQELPEPNKIFVQGMRRAKEWIAAGSAVPVAQCGKTNQEAGMPDFYYQDWRCGKPVGHEGHCTPYSAETDRAVEIGAKARYLASTVSAEPDWDRQTARAKDSYRDQVRPAVVAVLAAPRKVPNG